MALRSCVVSFCNSEGLRHSVKVQAESLYEAAVLAIKTFRAHECALGPAGHLEVEVKSPSVTHAVTVRKVQYWLDGGAKSPAERLVKQRLETLLVG